MPHIFLYKKAHFTVPQKIIIKHANFNECAAFIYSF